MKEDGITPLKHNGKALEKVPDGCGGGKTRSPSLAPGYLFEMGDGLGIPAPEGFHDERVEINSSTVAIVKVLVQFGFFAISQGCACCLGGR